jgi:hypothetical protein
MVPLLLNPASRMGTSFPESADAEGKGNRKPGRQIELPFPCERTQFYAATLTALW